MLNANILKTMKWRFYERRGYFLLNPLEAYKLSSQSYDDEQDNFILYSDGLILNKLLGMANLNGKTILDFGSGIGRNY